MLRVLVTLVVLGVLTRSVDGDAFKQLVAQASWPLVALAAVCMALAYPLQAVRLGILLRQQGVQLPFADLHRVTWIGVFFASFTPGGVGGDVVRLMHVYGRMPERKPGATVAVIADRVIGLAALLLLAAVAAAAYLRMAPTAAAEIGLLLPVFAVTLALVAAGWWLLGRLPFPSRFERLAPWREAARNSLEPPRPFALAAAVSLAIWTVDFFAGWLLARALGWPVGLLEISVALAVAYAVASLPVSVGGHGVREGALVIVLGWFGLEVGAVAFAVAFLTLTLGCGFVGAAVWLGALLRARREA